MGSYFSIVAVVGYLTAALLLARRLGDKRRGGRGAAVAAATIGLWAHAGQHFLFAAAFPDLHFVPSLSIAALLIAAIATTIAFRGQVEAIGIVAYPIAAVSALLFGLHAHAATASAPDWQIVLHVVLALLAFAVLSIAALVAIMLELQERALRQRRIATVMRIFPPLALVEALLFHLIAAGFVLLSATVLTGVLFIHDWFAQHLVHKTVLTLAAWVVFGTLLFGHRRWGWRGIRAARFTLAGIT